MLKENLDLYLKPTTKSIFWYNRYRNFVLKFNKKHDGNFERHHALPKSMFKEFEKSTWNLVELSYRAHYLAHYMLAKAVGSRMWYAFNTMNTLNKKHTTFNSMLFESARLKVKKEMSFRNSFKNLTDDEIEIKIKTIKKSHNAPNRGKHISEGLNRICENGKTIAQNRALKSAYTMTNTICENGNTISKNAAIKAAITLKENGHYKKLGKKLAYKLTLFDSNGIEVKRFNSKTNFWKWCKENDIPKNPLYKTFENNSVYNPKGRNKFKEKSERVIGWYLRKTIEGENDV